MGKDAIIYIVRYDGHGIPNWTLSPTVIPLDSYVEKPVTLMEVMPVSVKAQSGIHTKEIVPNMTWR